MAYAQPERDDDDAERLAWAQMQLLGRIVERLLAVRSKLKLAEQKFLDEMNTCVAVLREHPGDEAVQQLKDLEWVYRREMPRQVAPKLPPRDPIVMEREGRS